MAYKKLVENQKEYFRTDATKSYEFRMQQLNKLGQVIQKYESEIVDAFEKDMHKSSFEVYETEVGFILHSLRNTKKNLRSWMGKKKANNPLFLFGSKSYSLMQPYGTVLIIGPFNYPFGLVIEPLISAIAAGNTAIIKPSELTPNVANVIKKMIEEIFPPEYVSVVIGDVDETTSLLKESYDYIFFTGSPRVGKIIMKAAAEHLTPVTLELGGKSPAIVCKDADIKQAAKKITWGKFLNTGQTCVAPDYVYVEEGRRDQLIKELKKEICLFYGKDPRTNRDYGRFVSKRHFDRMEQLLLDTDARFVHGGSSFGEDLYVEPTLVTDLDWNDPLMAEEIFGPILPILTYKEEEFDKEVIGNIEKRERPLALYLFTKNKKVKNYILNHLAFGGGSVNDTILHLSNVHLPFGGIGNSGMGNYHGVYGFKTFSHQKAIIETPRWLPLSVLYPPYTNKKLSLLRKMLR